MKNLKLNFILILFVFLLGVVLQLSEIIDVIFSDRITPKDTEVYQIEIKDEEVSIYTKQPYVGEIEDGMVIVSNKPFSEISSKIEIND